MYSRNQLPASLRTRLAFPARGDSDVMKIQFFHFNTGTMVSRLPIQITWTSSHLSLGACLLSHSRCWSCNRVWRVLMWTSEWARNQPVRRGAHKMYGQLGSLVCAWEKRKVKQQEQKKTTKHVLNVCSAPIRCFTFTIKDRRVVKAVTTVWPGSEPDSSRAGAGDLPPLSCFSASEMEILMLTSWSFVKSRSDEVVKSSMPRDLSLTLKAVP